MALSRAELASPKKILFFAFGSGLHPALQRYTGEITLQLDWTEQELPDYDILFPCNLIFPFFFLFTQLLPSHLHLPHVSCFSFAFPFACYCKVYYADFLDKEMC